MHLEQNYNSVVLNQRYPQKVGCFTEQSQPSYPPLPIEEPHFEHTACICGDFMNSYLFANFCLYLMVDNTKYDNTPSHYHDLWNSSTSFCPFSVRCSSVMRSLSIVELSPGVTHQGGHSPGGSLIKGVTHEGCHSWTILVHKKRGKDVFLARREESRDHRLKVQFGGKEYFSPVLSIKRGLESTNILPSAIPHAYFLWTVYFQKGYISLSTFLEKGYILSPKFLENCLICVPMNKHGYPHITDVTSPPPPSPTHPRR